MLDLPLPFGPTITLTPGPNSSRVRSGNDLKPLSVIDFRCIGQSSSPPEPICPSPARGAPAPLVPPPAPTPSCCARPAPTGRPSTSATVSKRRSCGGPSSFDDGVGDELAALGEPLLQLALEVEHVRDRVLDLRLERLRDRRPPCARSRTRESRPRSPPRPPPRARSPTRSGARPGARGRLAPQRACGRARRAPGRPPRTSAG